MNIKTYLVVFGLLLTTLTHSLAQTSIATLDLQKVFDGYWKTKQISENLKTQGKEYATQRESLMKQFEDANAEYRKLKESAEDKAVSSSESQRRNAAADEQLNAIRAIERDIKEYDNTTRTQLLETQNRMKASILRDIKEKVAQIAKEKRYTLVIDTAAQARTETPILLYTDGSSDITEIVLTRMNAKTKN